jgi:Xaa-Pro aminopeptidase
MTMKTMQPTLKSGRNAWDRVNMPVGEFQERVRKLRKGMKERGIDILLAYGYAFNEYGNYCYLTNFSIRLPQGALVTVPREGPLSLMFEGASRGIPSVRKMTWVEDLRATGDVSKECLKFLQEKSLVPSVIGFAGLQRWMPSHQLQFLLDSLPKCKIVNADPLMSELRMLKSPLEIFQIRRASRIVARTFDFIGSAPFVPFEEKVLEAAARREARLEGAEDFRIMLARPSEEKWTFGPPEKRPLPPGGKVLIYMSVEFERYWAEGARTFMVKESSLEETQHHEVKALYDSIRGEMENGKKVSQFHRKSVQMIKKAGFDTLPDYGLGQGIGLSPKEAPVIAGEDRSILKTGMCLSLFLGVRNRAAGPTVLGETICLSRTGPEVLTR